MKRIIIILRPFELKQILYVYEDSNKLEMVQIETSKIPDAVFRFSQQYDVKQIDLSGPVHYAKGIAKQIQEKEIVKYFKNDLIINCI